MILDCLAGPWDGSFMDEVVDAFVLEVIRVNEVVVDGNRCKGFDICVECGKDLAWFLG